MNSIPTELIIDLCKTAYIIYNYMDKWELINFENYTKNITDSINKLTPIENKILMNFNEKYHDASVFTFIENSAGMECFILKNPTHKSYSIIFRGTESMKDCLCDFLINKHILHDDIKVHYGFYKQLTSNDTLQQLYNNIDYLLSENPDYKWNIAGHSLGGALAVLCGYILARKYTQLFFTVASFGSHRVGNLQFRNSFNNLYNITHYRVVNQNDIIPLFPYIGYYHCGYLIHYGRNNEWSILGNNIDNNNIFNCYNPYHHSCSNYVNNLDKFK